MSNRVVRRSITMFYGLLCLLLCMAQSGPARQCDSGKPLVAQIVVDRIDSQRFVLTVGTTASGLYSSGIGLGLAFDGTRAWFDGFEELCREGLLAESEAPEIDTEDLDQDAQTNRLLRVAWLDDTGRWMGSARQVTLLRAVFRRLPDPEDPEGRLPVPVNLVSLSQETAFYFKPLKHEVETWGQKVPSAPAEFSSLEQARFEQEMRVHGISELSSRTWREESWAEQTGRQRATCSLDVDANGQVDALTDGVLIRRYLFGFMGSTLIQNALGGGAIRTKAADIAAYLENSDCHAMLDADGNGMKDALTDGVIIARYLFGFSSATLINGAIGAGAVRTTSEAVISWLAFFRSLQPALELHAPELEAPLLSQLPASLKVHTRYTGGGWLVYSLIQSPTGMTINRDGIRWTPPVSTEGQQIAIKVAATDGQLSSEVTFILRVAASEALSTALTGQTITVTQAGTLKGLAFAFSTAPSVPLSQIAFTRISPTQAPEIPIGVTRLSDYFRTSPLLSQGGLISVNLPIQGLPEGRNLSDLRLFVYLDGITDTLGSEEKPFWSVSWMGLEVQQGGTVTIKLAGSGSLSFIGLEPQPPKMISQEVPHVGTLHTTEFEAAYNCSYLVHPNGLLDLNQQLCLISGDITLSVKVKNPWVLSMVHGQTLDDLLSWLVTAKKKFNDYGMKTEPLLEVSFDLDKKNNGYVTSLNNEHLRVLHLPKQATKADLLAVICAHEFFHHAQSRAYVAGKPNLINLGVNTKWLTEGTARWFDDEFNDNFNSYRMTEQRPLERILEEGLAASHVDGKPNPKRGYARYAFFKMLSNSCGEFKVSQLLNADAATDPKGAVLLRDRVQSPEWQCDFGNGFGEGNKATLASALLYYTYATLKEDDISKLDYNEPYFKFTESPWRLTPAANCADKWEACPPSAKWATGIFQAGSQALIVNSVPKLEAGRAIVIEIEPQTPGKDLWVWFGDKEKPGGLSTGAWYKSSNIIRHTLSKEDRSPETIIAIVNPDVQTNVNVRIRAMDAPQVVEITPASVNLNAGSNQTFTAKVPSLCPSPRKKDLKAGEGHTRLIE